VYHRRVSVQVYLTEGEQNVSIKTKTVNLYRSNSEIRLQYLRIFNTAHLFCKIKTYYIDLKIT